MFIQTLRNSIQKDSLSNRALLPNRHLQQPLDSVEGQPCLLITVMASDPYRACPGRFLAEASMYIVIANFLSTFVVSKAIGDDGKEMEPKIEVDAGIAELALYSKSWG